MPEDVRKALALMHLSLCEPLSMGDLARQCGVPERTLNDHFRTFVGRSPIRHLRRLRLAAARKALLSAGHEASVTEIAHGFLFAHPGRFSERYRAAFGETPSETRRRARALAAPPRTLGGDCRAAPSLLLRDTPSLAIVVAGAAGPAPSWLAGLGGALASGLCSASWLSVVLPAAAGAASSDPRRVFRETGARYVLWVRHVEDRDRLRLSFHVSDGATGAVLWGGHVDGGLGDGLELQDRLVRRIGEGIGPALRRAEIHRAARTDPRDLDVRGLALRATPLLLSATPEGASRALELLDRAMEMDPDHPLPIALAGWGHGQLVMYNATTRPAEERDRALRLARRAAIFGGEDPLELAARCTAHMMLGDLDAAEALVARALSRDPACGWAWSRSGWLQTYRGNPGTALRHFQRALRLELHGSRANTLVGIGCAHFDAGRYAAAARWVQRALRLQPDMEWCNRSLSVSYARLGERRMARRSLESLQRYHPDLAVRDVVAAVPSGAVSWSGSPTGWTTWGFRPDRAPHRGYARP
ncbi:MAG TPA: helix-turn-helix domain-containing protein [Planctomycetota bacterium]|nr:helix-turn-helix domain-containing protein [Planctomycetota bacterium]